MIKKKCLKALILAAYDFLSETIDSDTIQILVSRRDEFINLEMEIAIYAVHIDG